MNNSEVEKNEESTYYCRYRGRCGWCNCWRRKADTKEVNEISTLIWGADLIYIDCEVRRMRRVFEELIERYSKYDLDVAMVINDYINSMTGR